MPSFPKECQLAKDFISWICSAGGGGKDFNQADQMCVKILKFCKFCCRDFEDTEELTRTTLEYCIGSVDLIQKFLIHLEENCKLACSGIISYLQSLSHGLDFMRFKGLTPQKICFADYRGVRFKSKAMSKKEDACRVEQCPFHRTL